MLDPICFALNYIQKNSNVTINDLVEAYCSSYSASEAEKEGTKYGFKNVISQGYIVADSNGYLTITPKGQHHLTNNC